MSCPDCPPRREPRVVWVSHVGYHGACPEHRTTWELAGDAPASIRRVDRPSGYRDLDRERAVERAQ
jgi:hypothetical protein